jgi:predicted membrane protein
MYFSFLFFFGIWEKNLYKCCVTCFLIPMYVLLLLQQVKALYIYILGVKRLDFIIKSWITRKLLCVLLCRPLFIFLSFCFLAIILSVCLCIIVSTVVYLFYLMAKKQKDKKINNGRHNNTQTDNKMNKKQKEKKINNERHKNTQTNRQYNGQETKR